MDNNENSKDINKNYNLNSEAVDALSNADNEEIPHYSEEELSKYRKKKFQIPNWLKVIFIKFWFAESVTLFIWHAIPNMAFLDHVFVFCMVMGMVTDLLTNNVIRFIEDYTGANDKWLLVTKRGMVGFGLNLTLSSVVVIASIAAHVLIFGQSGPIPVVFGLMCMGFDVLFIGIKRLCISIFNDAKASARSK